MAIIHIFPADRTRRPSSEKETRRSLLARAHIAKKELTERLPHFDEDTYRHILETKFGVSSAAALTLPQLRSLLIHFNSLGFTAKSGRRAGKEDTPVAGPGSRQRQGGVTPLAGEVWRGQRPLREPAAYAHEPRLRKIEALLLEKGRVEGTALGWGYAEGILRRQTRGRVTRLSDADGAQLDGVIAALCRDAARKGRYCELFGREA